MDPLKLGSFDRYLLKREAQRFFEKLPIPHPARAFKDSVPSLSAVGNYDPNYQRGHEIYIALGKVKTWCNRRHHCAVANREKQHSGFKRFNAPVETVSKFVHSTIANSCM
jgi:hypothetical protein